MLFENMIRHLTNAGANRRQNENILSIFVTSKGYICGQTSRFFLLLVVHDNNFHNLPEPGEERPQIGLRHIGG